MTRVLVDSQPRQVIVEAGDPRLIRVVEAGPQGPQGPEGPEGPQGPAGDDGQDATLSDADPQALGTAAPGTATEASRSDHIHPNQTAAQTSYDDSAAGLGASTVKAALDALDAVQDGRGTMAGQDASSVAITGGAIDGTAVGGTTPAAGIFTDLSATGTISGIGASDVGAIAADGPAGEMVSHSGTAVTIASGLSLDPVSGDLRVSAEGAGALIDADGKGVAVGAGLDLSSGTLSATGGGSGAPIGAMLDYAGASAPAGWLLCDGATIGDAGSGATHEDGGYQALFDLIKDSWGNAGTEDFAAGDTVKLPDFRGRSPMGAGAGAGLTARTRGQALGEEGHALAEAELANHKHPTGEPEGRYTAKDDDSPVQLQESGTRGVSFPTPRAAGSDEPHNTIHPVLVAPKIIKAK